MFNWSVVTYPETNIETLTKSDPNLRVEVAGYKKDEIDVAFNKATGEVVVKASNKARGARQFVGYVNNDATEIEEAKLEDGILTLKFKMESPEFIQKVSVK